MALGDTIGTITEISRVEGSTLNAPVISNNNVPIASSGYAYQWYKDGIPIDGANSATYVVPSVGFGNYTVAITYTDSANLRLTLESAIREVTRIDNGPASIGFISSSVPNVFREGVILNAPAVTGDPDGDAIAPNYSYQWFKNGTAITGATASTYAVPLAGAGAYRVAITYSDAQNFRTTLNSTEQFVSTLNNGDTLLVPITSSTPGVFQEGVTLNAPSVTGDPDGDARTASSTYQWFINNAPINGATAASYAVPLAGAGTYKVQITYRDAQNLSVTLFSPDQVVNAFNNGNVALGSITSSLPSVFQEGVTLSAPAITGDPDGDSITANAVYQWYRNGTAINNATQARYTVPLAGAGTYKVAISYTDAQAFRVTLESASQAVGAFNNGNAALSSITSSLAGIFREGVTLIAPVVGDDPDGNSINPSVAYQWFRNGTAISGATASTYAVPATGAGAYKVAVSYTDAQNFRVTIDSTEQLVSTFNNGNLLPAPIRSSTAGVFLEGVTLIAPAVSGDPDGDTTTANAAYQWHLNGSPIEGATAPSYAVPVAGAGSYKVVITYTDAQDFPVTINSPEQLVEAVNNGNGTPQALTSATGLFQEGNTLIAPAVSGDPDGDSVTPNYAYQWYRNSSPITGADAGSYDVPLGGAGSYKVAITYSDAKGIRRTVNTAEQDIVTGRRTFDQATSANMVMAGDGIIDHFKLQSAVAPAASAWRIAAFKPTEDVLQIAKSLSERSIPRSLFSVQKAIVPNGALSQSEQKLFKSQQKALNKSVKRIGRTGDGFAYNQLTGELFVDTNGSKKGFGADGGLIAVLEGAPAIDISNFQFL